MRIHCVRFLLGFVLLVFASIPLRAEDDATARKATVSATQTIRGETHPLATVPVHRITVIISESENGTSHPLKNYTAAIVANGLTLWDFLPLDGGADKNAHAFQIADNVDEIIVYVRGTGPGVKYPANLQLNIGKVTADQTVAVVLTPTK